jgi:iron complex outermembrane recepter protein
MVRACLGFTILLVSGVSLVFAADETPATGGTDHLQEVVVTAEKRSENVQRAPATISVVSGDDLKTRGIQDISESTVMFSSVKLGQISGTVHMYIRGIGAEQDRASIDPLSAMTQNGIVLPREITGNNLFDVGTIEVLPGPQSTLYGASSAGGIVSVTTNRPTKRQEGSAIVEIGNYDFKHFTAVQNVPLSDTLAIRAAFDGAFHDGYQTSGADSEDQIAGRISALYQPNSEIPAASRPTP